ncbi:MAG: hypothetical protein CSYNP_00622 [Syntrophus sp. SKADARSKE-3]|nr:hypothetical protein [Syntrophus sp. SKADARSKE-3]
MCRASGKERNLIVFTVIAAFVMFFLVCGCGSSPNKEVQAAVSYVKSLLERAGKDIPAAMSFASIMESGGTPVSYIAANAPSGDSPLKKFTLTMDRPSGPWSIVIKSGAGPRDFVIEGYGEKTDAPLCMEKVNIGKFRPR